MHNDDVCAKIQNQKMSGDTGAGASEKSKKINFMHEKNAEFTAGLPKKVEKEFRAGGQNGERKNKAESGTPQNSA